jgi:hypothetical protein
MKTRAEVVGLIFFVLLTPLCLFGQDGASTLSIRGDIQKPLQWSVESLKAQFAGQGQEIKFAAGMDKSVKVGTGVPLLSVIQSAALQTDKAVKHHDLKFIVVVEAHDGYRVFFSLAELMPQAGNAQAWLLWNVDGKPLAGKEAPFRLVVLTDKAADRYIFGVTKIVVVDGIKVASSY